MKKIMKKALSLMLALVMVLTLAPMTGYAAVGDVATVVDNKTVVFQNNYATDDVEYTATAYGKLTLNITSANPDYYVGGNIQGNWFDAITGQGSGTHEFTVKAGETAVLNISADTSNGSTITYSVTFTELEAPKLGSQDNPYLIDGETAVTVKAGETAYVKYVGTVPWGGAYYEISADATAAGFEIVDLTKGEAVTYDVADKDEFSYIAKTPMYNDVVSFSVKNETNAEQTYTFTAASYTPEGNMYDTAVALGSLGTTTVDFPSINEGIYYYKWTATESGTFTLTIDENSASQCEWVMQIVDIEQKDGEFRSVYKTGSKENGTKKIMTAIETGETVWFYVYDENCGTLTFKTAVTDEVIIEDEPKDEPGDDVLVGGDDNYATSSTPINVGDNELTTSHMYEYTVFSFKPTEIGTYTLTTDNAVMGIVGYSSAQGVISALTSETVASKTLTMKCSAVGQEILVAVMPDTTGANIKVTKGDLEIKETHTFTYPASAPSYVFSNSVSDLTYVDVEDKTVDKAVYASDGYYHLNSVDGPILLVNLDDSVLSFVIDNSEMTNLTFGSMTVSYYEGDEIAYNISYAEALKAYIASADKFVHPEYGDIALYPLTDALLEIYSRYGAQQKWYESSDTFTGLVLGQFKNPNPEDIWMFACMYIPNAEDGSIVVPPVAIRPEVDEKGNVTNTTFTETVIESKIEQAIAENKPLVVETTTDGLTMTFSVEDLKDAKAVKLDIAVAVKDDVKDETVAKNDKITKDNFVMKIEFAHEGKLPAEATIVIPVPAEVAKAYKTLYYYQIMEDGSLKYVCDAPINSDGKAVVTQDHCSDYVLLTEKVDAPLAEEIVAPKTGDSTNYALWLAVLGLGVVAMAGSVVMKKREF